MDLAITFFALTSSGASAVTFAVMIHIEAKRRRTAVGVLFVYILAMFLCLWFMVGYVLILLGQDVDPAIYFRPMISVLMATFTATAVILTKYRNIHGSMREAREALALAEKNLQKMKEWNPGQ